MKKNVLLLLSLLWCYALQAGTPHKTILEPQNPTSAFSRSKSQAPQSKLTSWLLKKAQKKITCKQQRLEKKKQRLQAKGKTQRVEKIQKTQDGLATVGIVVMIGGLLSIVVGLVLLILSFNTGVYSFFISLGGLGLVVGFVLLLVGLVQ